MTASPTMTMPAPTAVPQGPCRITQVVAVPNPNPRYLAIHSEGAADAVDLRIYSKVLTLARTSQRSQALIQGWNHVDLEAGLFDGLPSGLYFVVVKPSRGQKPGIAGPIAKLYVLR